MSSRSDFISKRRRRAIYIRDDRHCVWCGALCEPEQLTLDHVVPRAHGGTHATRNLVTACLSCNSRRGCLSLLAFARIISARQCVAPSWIIVRVLSAAETPILHTSKRSARGQRGQLTMVLSGRCASMMPTHEQDRAFLRKLKTLTRTQLSRLLNELRRDASRESEWKAIATLRALWKLS